MNFIIDCTYISEWDGPIDEIDTDARINLVSGIVDNIQLNDIYTKMNLGTCLGHCVSFEFEHQEYDFILEDLGNSTYRVFDMENITLFQSVQNMLQLQNDLPINGHTTKKVKI